MNNVLFRRGDQTFIDKNVPLNDGQIIFNETDEAIYLDNTIGGTVVRKRYGGGNLSRSDIDMTLSTTSNNPIANKIVTNAIGNLSNLQTDAKTNLVSAINEVDSHANTNASAIGTLANLNTNVKTSTVAAINEVNTKVAKTEVLISNSGDAYSPTKPYAVGDLCIYNNVLYRCITACSAGSWATNQSCFTADTLVNLVSGQITSDNIGNFAISLNKVSPNAFSNAIVSYVNDSFRTGADTLQFSFNVGTNNFKFFVGRGGMAYEINSTLIWSK